MKNVLILGAGLVAAPMVRYLLDQPNFHVTVASRTVSKAKDVVGDHPHGRAVAFDIEKQGDARLDEIVRDRLNEELLDLWARTGKTTLFVTHSIPEAVYLVLQAAGMVRRIVMIVVLL